MFAKIDGEGLTCSHKDSIPLNKAVDILDTCSKFENNLSADTQRLVNVYIFDEDKLLRPAVFSQTSFSDYFGYGLLLPKEKDMLDKKGDLVGYEQVWNPVMVSNHSLFEISKENMLKHKMQFNAIPSNLPLRWSLKSIKSYLQLDCPAINGYELFKKIRQQYEKYSFYRDSKWYDVHSLWDFGTYSFMIFNSYPLMELRGISGSSKSKQMRISSYIAFNATDLMVNPSESSLFRETHDKRPTKYIDEAERLFKYNPKTKQIEQDSRAELINASYSKNGVVPRVEKIGNKFVTFYYHCYSPTQIASINGLFGATENRAITHIMTKSPDNDKRGELDPETDVDDPIWQEIRDELYIYTLQNWQKIKDLYRNFNEETKLKKRDLQIWKPLLVIAKLLNDDIFQDVLAFAEKISEQRKQDLISEGSFDFKILNVVRSLVLEDSKIYVKTMRDRYGLLYPSDEIRSGFNKTISSKLDNLGFKELRKKDMTGSYFEITQDTFETIVAPICPDLSSYSSYSSENNELKLKNKKSNDESMMNDDESNFKVEKIYDEYDENDEYDDDRGHGGIKKQPMTNDDEYTKKGFENGD
jgi:hypothetical protein